MSTQRKPPRKRPGETTPHGKDYLQENPTTPRRTRLSERGIGRRYSTRPPTGSSPTSKI